MPVHSVLPSLVGVLQLLFVMEVPGTTLVSGMENGWRGEAKYGYAVAIPLSVGGGVI